MPLPGVVVIVLDSAGDLFISDSGNRIREVNQATGIITTIVGNGTDGYSGDGGPAKSAELLEPFAVALDSHGNTIIADAVNKVNEPALSAVFASRYGAPAPVVVAAVGAR